MHQHPRAGAAFSHALCSQSSYPFCFSPTLEFFFVVTRMIYQNRWKKRFCVWRSPPKKSCSNEIFIRTVFESFEREGQRGGGGEDREYKGSVSARNFLGNRIGHNLEYLFLFERKLHLPLNAYRSLLLTCCVLLHSRGNPICTVNALTAVSIEDRMKNATRPWLLPKKKERKK